MTILDTLNFVAFNPLQNNNPIAVRRRKLIAKIDEQIQLAANKDYTPTQHKMVTDELGNQRKVEVAKRVRRWWTPSNDKEIMDIRYSNLPHYLGSLWGIRVKPEFIEHVVFISNREASKKDFKTFYKMIFNF